MKSINFAEATHILGVSQGYQPLAVIRTEEKGVVINNSYWQLEPEEIELLKKGHMIHLGVLGGQPPILMAISNKPIEPLPYVNYKIATPDDVKKLLEGLEQPKGILPNLKTVEKIKCAVCDGTGFKNGAAGGDEACRFCHGGYLDAAN